MAYYSVLASRGMRGEGIKTNVSHVFGQILSVMELEPDHNFNESEKMCFQIREVEITDEQIEYMKGVSQEDHQIITKKYRIKQSAYPQAAWDALQDYQLVEISGVNYSDGRNGAAPQLNNSNIEEIV